MAARFMGVVDVPLFSAPYSLGISGYQGFDASPRFARNCQAPLFSYLPSSANTNDGEVARVVSIIPNLTTQSEALRNPTQVAGLTGMSFRLNWVDGYTWLLNELPVGGGGLNYRWNVWRFQQPRNGGLQNLGVPPVWYIDRDWPNAGFAQNRIEFTGPVLPCYDFEGLGNAPLLMYQWANAYNRVYGMVYTPFGWKLRNLFSALTLPGATWPNFTSGSLTALCRNEFANSFGFGFFNRGGGNYGYGLGFGNFMFVGKGTKDSPYVVAFRTYEYDPDTIDGQAPRFEPVGLPEPYTDAFEAATDVQAWQGGFVFTLLMNGAGYTGERQEIIVTDPMCSVFYVLRLVPQNASAAEALKTTTTAYCAKIDTEGTLWFYNGGSPGFKDALYYSFAPRLFFNPTLADFDFPAITMPCYNTCLPGYL